MTRQTAEFSQFQHSLWCFPDPLELPAAKKAVSFLRELVVTRDVVVDVLLLLDFVIVIFDVQQRRPDFWVCLRLLESFLCRLARSLVLLLKLIEVLSPLLLEVDPLKTVQELHAPDAVRPVAA
jgi:hypothetical protein